MSYTPYSAFFQLPLFVSSGNYLGCPLSSTAITNAATANGVIYLTPIIVPPIPSLTFTALNFGTVVVSAQNFKTGLYANNPATNKPTGLPITNTATTTGPLTSASTTLTDATAFGAAITPTPGLYWAAMLTDNTGTVRVFNTANQGMIFGTSTSSDSNGNALSFTSAYAGGLVDLTGASLTETLNTSMKNLRLKVQ